MILGIVNASLEAVVKLSLVGGNMKEEDIEVVIDTGFNAGLSVPVSVADSLNWIPKGDENVVLADGSETSMSLYRGIVTWHNQPKITDVIACDSKPLLGTSLLEGDELKIDFRRGGTVTITPLP